LRRPDFLKRMELLKRRNVGVIVTVALLVLLALLPFVMGTSTYPFAIVEGNSMYPALRTGDLVLFRGASPQGIANGSIIVFVQGDTGIGALDSLLRPVVIHRVVGVQAGSDGMMAFDTKGDNNLIADASVVQGDHVLGVPAQVIPYAGYVLLFVRSPQGLVAIVAFITLFYLASYETRAREERRKEEFLGAVAQRVLAGEIPEELFRKVELTVRYAGSLDGEELKDDRLRAIASWIRGGGLEHEWKVSGAKCTKCGSAAVAIEDSTGEVATLCPRCDVGRAESRPEAAVPG
jgi:signal peptidase